MYTQIETPTPQRAMDTYTIATPYGTVIISEGGRRVAFELYSDVRQSRHNTALFTYVQQLLKKGVTQFNTDHITIAGSDRRLSLNRGKSRLDLVYIYEGRTYECELKTSRQIGIDSTAQQIREFAKYCERLILLVPRGCTEEAATILTMINLKEHVAIQAYDDTDIED